MSTSEATSSVPVVGSTVSLFSLRVEISVGVDEESNAPNRGYPVSVRDSGLNTGCQIQSTYRVILKTGET